VAPLYLALPPSCGPSWLARFEGQGSGSERTKQEQLDLVLRLLVDVLHQRVDLAAALRLLLVISGLALAGVTHGWLVDW